MTLRSQVAEIDPLIASVVSDTLRLPFDVVSVQQLVSSPSAARRDGRGVGSSGGDARAPNPSATDNGNSLVPSRPPPLFSVALSDAADVVSSLAAAVSRRSAEPASLIFLDAYERCVCITEYYRKGLHLHAVIESTPLTGHVRRSAGNVPAHLKQPVFLAACGQCLSPAGLVVVNLFNGARLNVLDVSFSTKTPHFVFFSPRRWAQLPSAAGDGHLRGAAGRSGGPRAQRQSVRAAKQRQCVSSLRHHTKTPTKNAALAPSAADVASHAAPPRQFWWPRGGARAWATRP